MGQSAIHWFRNDLRLDDNAAWSAAVQSGAAVLPVYIFAEGEADGWELGGASRWWLHHALADLDQQLNAIGSRLILRRGNSEEELERLVHESGAAAVYWNRNYEVSRTQRDARIKERLKENGIQATSCSSYLLFEPWQVATQAGQPYKVYTPFSRQCANQPIKSAIANPGKPGVPEAWPESLSLEELELLPTVAWDKGFYESWNPTRAGGLARLEQFLHTSVRQYSDARNFPAEDGTSRLSPYLRWGQVGAREVFQRLKDSPASEGRTCYHRELVWREFGWHVIYHFPATADQPLQPKFRDFPWRSDSHQLEAWQRGQTGYPLVDAGMRQLWTTGWMHNRVRMVVASFLVKHLLISWHAGAKWFWDTLVDSDLASNSLGWQWAGGCGADAAPYFRIFNPITQSQKFDPEGNYIRRFVPELRNVPEKWIHTPWEMPLREQLSAGCRIGENYPAPIIDHKEGRERALKALESTKE